VGQQFNPRIESLRGVAALAVVITHSTAIFRVDGAEAFWTVPIFDRTAGQLLLTPVLWMSNAGAAVVLFFVISGYVLTLSYRGDVGPYLFRRAMRLLPPMWLSILIFAAVTNLIPAPAISGFSAWFVAVYGKAPSAVDLFRNTALLDFSANPVTWTMYVEVIGSISIPLFAFAARRLGFAFSLAGIAACGVLLFFNYPALTASYLVCFAAGALLASFPGALGRFPKPGLAGGALLIISGPALPVGCWWIFAATLGSCLVLSALSRADFLDWPAFRHIGRSSYSLYLVHLAIIYCISVAIERSGLQNFDLGLLPHFIALLATIPLSILAADALYRIIELPSIRIGKLGQRAFRASSEVQAG
jgi:peptidoglycan/LPS O-acetylase OafA/YrhL